MPSNVYITALLRHYDSLAICFISRKTNLSLSFWWRITRSFHIKNKSSFTAIFEECIILLQCKCCDLHYFTLKCDILCSYFRWTDVLFHEAIKVNPWQGKEGGNHPLPSPHLHCHHIVVAHALWRLGRHSHQGALPQGTHWETNWHSLRDKWALYRFHMLIPWGGPCSHHHILHGNTPEMELFGMRRLSRRHLSQQPALRPRPELSTMHLIVCEMVCVCVWGIKKDQWVLQITVIREYKRVSIQGADGQS